MLTCTTVSGCISPPVTHDLAVRFESYPATIAQGLSATYKISVTNYGPQHAATGAVLSFTATGGGYLHTGGTLPTSGSTTIDLAVGETKYFTVKGYFQYHGLATVKAQILPHTGSNDVIVRNNQVTVETVITINAP
jgi:hypothetical protein